MYNPNCYGDPATTDDEHVWCNGADGGGVHANSGIPNQAYALFTDGGVFNSATFTGVGLVKAFHIYMRGLSKHVPSTTFSQHADFVMAVRSGVVPLGHSNPYTRLAMNSPRTMSISRIH